MLASVAAASAADLPVMVVEPAAPPPAPVFSWAGPYVGAFGGFTFGLVGDAGLQAGFNFVNGGFVAGVEARAGVGFAGPVFFTTVGGRAGFLVGERALLYGAAAVGYLPVIPAFFYTAGGGTEVAVGTNLSLFAEARALSAFGGGCCLLTIQAGFNWHP